MGILYAANTTCVYYTLQRLHAYTIRCKAPVKQRYTQWSTLNLNHTAISVICWKLRAVLCKVRQNLHSSESVMDKLRRLLLSGSVAQAYTTG